MALQLIFVVETNSKCKSDWIYIKDTIEHFYKYDLTKTKFTPVYMNGKGNYKNKENDIKTLMAQFAHSNKDNQTNVIYCFDCDDYDVNQVDANFLKNAKEYCERQGYDFVWFCKDIECVYLNKKVIEKEKKKEASAFKEKKAIINVDSAKLSANTYKANASNLMKILDIYLKRK